MYFFQIKDDCILYNLCLSPNQTSQVPILYDGPNLGPQSTASYREEYPIISGLGGLV